MAMKASDILHIILRLQVKNIVPGRGASWAFIGIVSIYILLTPFVNRGSVRQLSLKYAANCPTLAKRNLISLGLLNENMKKKSIM